MSATFYDEVQQLRRRYPNPLSAVLPALQLAQERNGGWLSEATLREPVGKHLVEVCTNVSCALSGAQDVVEAFERSLGITVGETTEDGSVTLRTVECLGGCGWATVVAVDNRHKLHVRAPDVAGIVQELAE